MIAKSLFALWSPVECCGDESIRLNFIIQDFGKKSMIISLKNRFKLKNIITYFSATNSKRTLRVKGFTKRGKVIDTVWRCRNNYKSVITKVTEATG